MNVESKSGGSDEEANARAVYINDPQRTSQKSKLASNNVRTSKYTIATFLPKNLFEQFHRYAYIYFLIIVILNQIPLLAVFGRTASVFPLAFVLVITAIKDAYEDWGRHRSDQVENNRTCLVLQDGEYRPKKWKNVLVGEVVKIHDKEAVPCDLVLLGTSDSSGVAYVETSNLDGESNLKSRYAMQETSAQHPELGSISGTLICEAPHKNIYEFTAYIDLGGVHRPLGPTNLILRSCEIRNTSWIVAVVVYTGKETKAMLNTSGKQSKRSKLEEEMNRETLWLGLFLFVLCLVGGVGSGLWTHRHSNELDTLQFYKKRYAGRPRNYRFYGTFGEGMTAFLSFVIVFQVMIPIALYISMELVRLGQAFFMTEDVDLYHEASDTRFQCRALNLNEDLGQIKYVFCDKTGTLTVNKMEFHAASINGVDYSNAQDAVEDQAGNIEGPSEVVDTLQAVLAKQTWKPKVGARLDLNLVQILQQPVDSEERRAVHEYLLVLAACNTVVPTKVTVFPTTGHLELQAGGSGSEEGGVMQYQGESPDEQALVEAAALYGYTLLERSSSHIILNVLGEVLRFEILGIHEFDSTRKRMSVIIRCPDGTIKLLMKGADTVVLNLIGTPESQEIEVQRSQDEISSATLNHLDHYAREGLRTLVVATQNLNAKDVQMWEAQYRKASNALADRAKLLQDAAGLVERNLRLAGATGIEDKLQEGVPETIALLRDANMQVWVLTGDKQETAISIAFSCLLITPDMQQVIINETTRDGCKGALANARSLYGIDSGKRKMTRNSFWNRNRTIDNAYDGGSPVGSDPGDGKQLTERSKSAPQQPLALVIDGNSLVHCLSEELEQELFNVSIACKVVVCCRVAPLQKAGVVSLVKRKTKAMTLAIGDGANDVSMIQIADVGIGISGQEGRQAVMASDFAMGQFRFLKRVLLVHGHWNYTRLGYMVLYNFYRNAVFVLILFWFILYSAFSPRSAITDWNLIFYSLIYTSIPTIVVGILDKDLSDKTLLRFPALYIAGQNRVAYSQPLFWAVMVDTMWQSLVLFYVPYFTYRNTAVSIFGLGSLWIISVVHLVTLHLAMDIHHWTWIQHVATWGSLLATWMAVLVMDSLKSVKGLLPHYWVTYHMVGEWTYWFDILLILTLGLLPRFCIKVFWQLFFPSDIRIAGETEFKNNNDGIIEQGAELIDLHDLP